MAVALCRQNKSEEHQIMNRNTLLAAVAVAVLLPSAALAQETCEQRAQNRVAGTVVGAGVGALLGSALSGHGHKSTGAVVGGVAGAVIGNQVAKGPKDCQHAYGWYDNEGRWHANRVDASVAHGYYDQRGEWVEGMPADYRPAEYRDQDRYDRDRRDRDDWDRGDWERDRGYPEFRQFEEHIRDEIRGDVRQDLIEPEDARDLMDQLRDIHRQEAREFAVHGPNLPMDDRMRIRRQLERLDHEVDRIRDEP